MKLFLTVFLIANFSIAKDSAKQAPKESVDRVIAVVNSEPILQSELNSMPTRSKKEGGLDDALLLGEKPEKIRGDSKAQLDYLVREKLIESEVKRLNLTLSEDRINSEMQTLAKRNQMSKSELEIFFKKQGYSTSEYRSVLKAKLERQSFFEAEVISKLRITDEDAYSEFRAQFPKYKPVVNEFSIAQIYFNPKKGSGADALKRAEQVLSKLSAGESFESLANKFNEDPRANKDGALGSFKSGEFLPEIESAIATLDKNQSTQIVKSKIGFHIVKVLDKKITQDPQFLRIKEQIKAALVEKNFKRQLKNWFESKKQDAYIKYN
jgi:peptidyl-prolyl cis-trans isomerase SurA